MLMRPAVLCPVDFSDASRGDAAQFPGWPITVNMADNDGREPVAWLPELQFKGGTNPVVQVVEVKSGDVLYTVRVQGTQFQPAVYARGRYTVKIGPDKPDAVTITHIEATDKTAAGRRTIEL